jgi:hypothetical protein
MTLRALIHNAHRMSITMKAGIHHGHQKKQIAGRGRP